MPSVAWTRDELLETLKLYCVTPFGRLHSRNREIIRLAQDIGRTPSAVALKMTNFAALDPTIDRQGMANFSKLDRAVWNEFFANVDAFVPPPLEPLGPMAVVEDGLPFESFPAGLDIPAITTARSGQSFFRSMILASYDNRCALTDIDTPDLLVASHIRRWALEPAARTNPRNGLLLNRLHDRAFEAGLITVGEDFSVRYSPKLSGATYARLSQITRAHLRLPAKFAPEPDFLAYHRREIFKS